MIRVIYKYELDPTTGGQFGMPPGAQFVDLQMQNGKPVMWWSLPYEETRQEDHSHWELRTFCIAVTGRPGYAADGLHYVGTFQSVFGLTTFVGHVFAFEEFDRV